MENIKIQIAETRLKPLKVDGKSFLSSNDFQVTENDLENAREELNETNEIKVECLRKLRERLNKHKDVKYCTADNYLLRYLRHCKFDCGKAYSMIRNFYSTRMKRPDIFSIPSNIESLLNQRIVSYLPYRDEDGSILVWVNYGNWKLEEVTALDLVRIGQIITDIICMNPAAQINRIVCIWDFEGLTASHLSQLLYPSFFRVISSIIQDMHPWRVKLVLLLNSGKLLKTAYSMIKPLVKKKIHERVKFIGSNVEEIHQYVPPAILPKKYGGFLDESDCSITEHVMNNMNFLKSERSFEFH